MKAIIFRSFDQWCAEIEGPWYSDSNPEGRADTKEEACALACARLLEMQDEINEFLAEGKITFKIVQ